jgi:hypothetical protein
MRPAAPVRSLPSGGPAPAATLEFESERCVAHLRKRRGESRFLEMPRRVPEPPISVSAPFRQATARQQLLKIAQVRNVYFVVAEGGSRYQSEATGRITRKLRTGRPLPVIRQPLSSQSSESVGPDQQQILDSSTDVQVLRHDNDPRTGPCLPKPREVTRHGLSVMRNQNSTRLRGDADYVGVGQTDNTAIMGTHEID